MGGREGTDQTAYEYSNFCLSVERMTYWAMPQNSNVAVHGGIDASEEGLPDYELRRAVDYMIAEVLSKLHSQVQLYVVANEDTKYVVFNTEPSAGSADSGDASILYHAQVDLDITDLGIDRRTARRSLRLLRNNHDALAGEGSPEAIDRSPYDLQSRMLDSSLMAERAGRFVFWTGTDESKFSEAYIALNRCDLIILSIRCCKVVEKLVNDTLRKAPGGVNWAIDIPTYDMEKLIHARKEFIDGKMGLKGLVDVLLNP